MYGTQNRMNNAWYITMYNNIHIYTTRESHPIYALFVRFILACHYQIPILSLKKYHDFSNFWVEEYNRLGNNYIIP